MNTNTRFGLLTLSIITALTGTASANEVPAMLKRPAEQTQTNFEPDPAKRLTIANFEKGMGKLHEYLTNAVKNAKDEDKKFLIKEKAEIEKQMANPKKAYDDMFASIEKEYQRSIALKIFPENLTKEMRKYFLETEAARVLGAMQAEQKKRKNDRVFAAEVNYQKGIIAERDQVNYKSAVRHYEHAANGQPNNIDYLNALSRMYMVVGDHGSAVKRYTELLSLVKKQPNSEKKVKHIKKQLQKALKKVQLAAEG